MPKVSVVITCYNYAHYLPDAVGSVVNQTYKDFEVIIVNDGSPDNTLEVALGLIEKHPGRVIRLIDQENEGLPTARNNGIKAADGEYVLPLDADDVLLPSYLEKLVPVLEGRPEICLAYSWSEKFGEESGTLKHGEFVRKTILMNEGPLCTILLRKSAWATVGGYSLAMSKGFEDWEFHHSLLEAGCRGAVVPEALFMYRRHGRTMAVTRDEVVLEVMRGIKLLHPGLYAPLASRVSLSLARAVIIIKCRTRDPVMKYIYDNHPGFHAKLKAVKYGLFVR